MSERIPLHGTRSEYQYRGCRCSLCREAVSRYAREYRNRVRTAPRRTEPQHGTVSEYTNHACRCLACTTAKAAAKRHYRATRKERTDG